MNGESMLAAWFQDGQASLVERPRPQAAPGLALVKVRLAGVCNTDLELLRGYYGFTGVPGHEFVGQVVEAPGQPGLLGQRVVADINWGCGRCHDCLGGDPRHCPERAALGIKHWDGAFAQYLLAPLANLHPVPEGLDDRQAVFAEPLAAALQVAQQVHITAGQRVAVLGDGKLGLLTALALRPYSPGLLLIGRHAGKLAHAQAQGLATLCLEPGQEEPPSGCRAAFDLVVEATGQPQGLEQALALTRARGTVVAKTTSHLPSQLNLARVVVDEIRIQGSRCGQVGQALKHLEAGWLKVEPLIEAVYPLAQLGEAMARAGARGALKVLLAMEQE